MLGLLPKFLWRLPKEIKIVKNTREMMEKILILIVEVDEKNIQERCRLNAETRNLKTKYNIAFYRNH